MKRQRNYNNSGNKNLPNFRQSMMMNIEVSAFSFSNRMFLIKITQESRITPQNRAEKWIIRCTYFPLCFFFVQKSRFLLQPVNHSNRWIWWLVFQKHTRFVFVLIRDFVAIAIAIPYVWDWGLGIKFWKPYHKHVFEMWGFIALTYTIHGGLNVLCRCRYSNVCSSEAPRRR